MMLSNETVCTKLSRQSGFTLVEILMGMLIFTILAIGIAAASIQSQEIAHRNIYRNTAFAIVQGYAEQIKSLPIREIEAVIADPTNRPIPTMSLSTLGTVTSGTIKKDDPLYIGVTNHKVVLVDLVLQSSGSYREKTMDLWVTPICVDLTSAGIEAIEISLDFEWQKFPGSDDKGSSTVKLVKTNVSEF